MNLNQRAKQLSDQIVVDAESLRIEVSTLPCGAQIIDCGVAAAGGIEAGIRMSQVCMAGLAEASIGSFQLGDDTLPAVTVRTDHPAAACLASQYAGWELKHDDCFAMGSGPMRAAAGREPLFDDIGFRETAAACVGVLETNGVPPNELCQEIAEKCRVSADKLTLLIAPTRSLAGTIQIVARSVETALHKLHELEFDLDRIVAGWGQAPLPPPAADDLAAIGRTNDAILYGAHAVLYVRGDDASIDALGAQAPSSASNDYGRPFAETLAKFNHDFYQVDPLLFSPAKVTFVNLDSGRSQSFGKYNASVLRESFGW